MEEILDSMLADRDDSRRLGEAGRLGVHGEESVSQCFMVELYCFIRETASASSGSVGISLPDFSRS
jgi:hypothetical protein